MVTGLRFQGKIAFQGTNPLQPCYLSRSKLPLGNGFQPAMDSPSLGASEICHVYQIQSDPIRMVVQLAGLDYLTLLADLGWIQLSHEVAKAARFEISTAANGQQSWQVASGNQLLPIYYCAYNPDLPPPILTVNGPDQDSFSSFSPHVITPGLDTVTQTKNGAGMDFSGVDLSGQDVSGVDFTGAQFSGANLTGTLFKGATLAHAVFKGATLAGTCFDAAILDYADFSGPETVLATVDWGHPKSAQFINFSGCSGQGTQLGASGATIAFNHADLSKADFTGANLSKLVLDDAILDGLIAPSKADFSGASLLRVSAHGANFAGSIFDSATLSNGQFGSKALLFAFTDDLTKYTQELDASTGPVPADIVTALQGQRIDLSQGTVTVWVKGASWLVSTIEQNYNFIYNLKTSQLLLYRYGGVLPATFTSASLYYCVSSGASFASADMSNTHWHFATADHTDLESVNATGSFLLETDFSQAQLFGTTLSDSVLVQVKLIGATLRPNLSNTPTSFSNAQLQGADFTNAILADGNLTGAAVALPSGVPLFVMDGSYASNLESGDLKTVATVFAGKGYPLGSGASIGSSVGQGWLIDNSANANPPCVKAFFVDGNLNVYDCTRPSLALFMLPDNYANFLAQPKPAKILVSYFNGNNYPLSPQASISPCTPAWQILNTQDAPVDLPVVYQNISIIQQLDGLHVYGATGKLWVKNAKFYPFDIAFGVTLALEAAMDSQSLCPNGQAKGNQGSLTWEQMMTRT